MRGWLSNRNNRNKASETNNFFENPPVEVDFRLHLDYPRSGLSVVSTRCASHKFAFHEDPFASLEEKKVDAMTVALITHTTNVHLSISASYISPVRSYKQKDIDSTRTSEVEKRRKDYVTRS